MTRQTPRCHDPPSAAEIAAFSTDLGCSLTFSLVPGSNILAHVLRSAHEVTVAPIRAMSNEDLADAKDDAKEAEKSGNGEETKK